MFRPYPKMKDSGVEWLGKVPAHWSVKRLKDAARINSDILTETTPPDYKISYVDISSVEETEGVGSSREIEFSEAPSRARRIVKPGDTILSTVRTYLKAVAHFDAPPANLIVSTGFAVLGPGKGISPKFLYYMVRCEEFVQAVVAHSAGVSYPAINPSELSTLAAWIPSLEEQRAIASFLDRKTALIDDLIAKRERQIELLQEQRTALISRAVTKGLNPDVTMKNSGVEWLGEVPEHWETKKLKRIVSLKSGDGIVSENIDEAGEFPVYGGNGLRGFTSRYTHDGFYILIGRQGALCGNINYANGKFWASEHAVVVSPITEIAPKWLGELLRAMNLNQYSVSAAQPGLSVDAISNLYIPCPRFSEQQAISSLLDCETVKIDTFVTKVQQSIEKLREYRQSLISAAVTGKIDVRNWKPSSEPTEEPVHAS